MKKRYNRLVRDCFPTILQERGEEVLWHTADEEEYKQKLNERLLFEVEQYIETESFDDLLDIGELLYALSEVHGMDYEMFKKLRLQKRDEQGGFDKRVILEKTTRKNS